MTIRDKQQTRDAAKAGSGQTLRGQAERHAWAKPVLQSSELCDDSAQTLQATQAMQAMLHELQVHQIELEMQNEELRRVQAERDIEREGYVDLYDLAPVGYLTLSERGLIVKANLTCAALLGLPRAELLKKPISRFILKEDQDAYYLIRQQVIAGSGSSCELQMVVQDGSSLWVQLTATKAMDLDGAPLMRLVVLDITHRKQAEKKRASQSLLIEELSHRLVQAHEQARRRFSRELHDRTSPNLAALRINLDIITQATPGVRATAAYSDRIEDTRALIKDTTLSVREICAELHPPALDAGGLLGVVQSYAQPFARRTGLQVRVQCPHAEVRLAPSLELALFRIVQEALTNCAKHASAKVVLVRLQLDSEPKLLSVLDDGVGFELNAKDGLLQPAGQGLRNMKETAEFVGGRFGLESVPGRGTRVSVEL